MSQAGTLLNLKEHQIKGFIDGDICPSCKFPNIIFRSWRNDYLCGHCFEVYVMIDGQVRHLGNQKNLE